MKYTLKFTSLLFFIAIAAFSCKNLLEDLPTTFKIPYTTTFTIPANTTINIPINISTPDIITNSASTFETNKTSTDLIKKVSLSIFDLEIINPTTGNFNFLKDITVYISADGVSEQKIASKLNMANDNVKKISLELSAIDLKQYLIKDKIKLRVEATTDELITQDYQLKTDMELTVDANILN